MMLKLHDFTHELLMCGEVRIDIRIPIDNFEPFLDCTTHLLTVIMIMRPKM